MYLVLTLVRIIVLQVKGTSKILLTLKRNCIFASATTLLGSEPSKMGQHPPHLQWDLVQRNKIQFSIPPSQLISYFRANSLQPNLITARKFLNFFCSAEPAQNPRIKEKWETLDLYSSFEGPFQPNEWHKKPPQLSPGSVMNTMNLFGFQPFPLRNRTAK